MSRWQEQNLATITQRLAAVRRLLPGVLFEQISPYNHIIVRRTTDQLLLCYRDTEHKTEEVESRLTLDTPLSLSSLYTQVMLLALTWTPAPRRILLIGLGGGRLQMVLHHYLEKTTLYTIEIDPVVVEVACRFFGIAPDERQQIIIKDGRDYLRGMPAEAPYDIILLDAYQASGIPFHLRTREFYAECCSALSTTGVVATNLQRTTPLYDAALRTFLVSFSHTAVFPVLGGNVVVIGTNAGPLSFQEICDRARTLESRYAWQFSLPEHAQSLVTAPRYRQNAEVLHDAKHIS
jgi:spermidine synthase